MSTWLRMNYAQRDYYISNKRVRFRVSVQCGNSNFYKWRGGSPFSLQTIFRAAPYSTLDRIKHDTFMMKYTRSKFIMTLALIVLRAFVR